MSGVFEEIRREGELKTARRLLDMKTMSYEEIAAVVDLLSVEDIRAMDVGKTA